MSSGIYSIIRCTGAGACDCIYRQLGSDIGGRYGIRKIGGSKNDQIIWFSSSHNDFGDHITEEFLLKKLDELGSGKVYEDPHTTTYNPDPISGTIKC